MHVVLTVLSQPLVFILLVLMWIILSIWIIFWVLERINRAVVIKTATQADDRIISLIRVAFVVGVIVTAMYSIAVHFNLSTYTTIDINKLFASIFIVSLCMFLYGCISIILIQIHERKYDHLGQPVHAAVPFLNNILKFVMLAVAVVIVLRLYKIDITPALASAGVVGVALALAAKDMIANLFGGLSIFFDKPYTIGDYVIIDQLHRGEVQDIGMRSTKIRTRDGILVTVPNSLMATTVVVNETGFDTHLRIRIPLQVAYGSNLDYIESILLSIALGHPEVLDEPRPLVRFRSYTDSGVSLEVLVVISMPSERGRIIHELIKRIHIAFVEEKIMMPYPHRHLLVEKVETNGLI